MNEENMKDLDTFDTEKSTTSDISYIGEEKMDTLLHLTFGEAQERYGTHLEKAPSCLRLKFANCLSVVNNNDMKYAKDISNKRATYVILLSSLCISLPSDISYFSKVFENKTYHSNLDAYARIKDLRDQYNHMSYTLGLQLEFGGNESVLIIQRGKEGTDNYSEVTYAVTEITE